MRIGNFQIGRVTTTTEPAPTNEKLFDSVLGGMVSFSNDRLSNEKTISTKILQANRGWVYRNNDAIAKEVSKMEFELYTIGLSQGEIVYNPIESHPLLDLLDKFNEETTTSDAMYIIQSHKKLSGDAFVVKLRQGGQVVALRSLPPDKVELRLQTPSEKDPTVIESYVYKDVIDGNKIEVVYAPEDIVHFKTPNPNNPFRGLGTVEALADTIDLDNLATEVNKKYFLNGAIHNFALTSDSKITSDQLKRLKAELRQTISGVKNAFSVPVFGGGLKPVDISYSNKDSEYIAQLEWYRDKIMYGFGNTKASLGMIDDVNRASHEGSIIEWQRNTVKPDMQAIVDTLNEFLVPDFGETLVLGFCDPVPEDRSDDLAEVAQLYPIGIMTLNEARALVDLEEVDNGDEVYQKPVPIVANPADNQDNQND
jgi:HK97 family phage portal protein